jgi:hypothetical protein
MDYWYLVALAIIIIGIIVLRWIFRFVAGALKEGDKKEDR